MSKSCTTFGSGVRGQYLRNLVGEVGGQRGATTFKQPSNWGGPVIWELGYWELGSWELGYWELGYWELSY
jgi:hypothetical protein